MNQPPRPLSTLSQEQLDWIARFADRLRHRRPEWTHPPRSHEAEAVAQAAWEQPGLRQLAPEDAAERWLSG